MCDEDRTRAGRCCLDRGCLWFAACSRLVQEKFASAGSQALAEMFAPALAARLPSRDELDARLEQPHRSSVFRRDGRWRWKCQDEDCPAGGPRWTWEQAFAQAERHSRSQGRNAW